MSDDRKLRAEWFWVDRWDGSSGKLLPLAPRGLYREMLTQAWRRGARLPNDPEAIRRACGVTAREWRACWPKVAPFWRVEGDVLINNTQLEVYAEAVAQVEKNRTRAKRAANARWGSSGNARGYPQAHAQALPEEMLEQCPPSPSPSPSPVSPSLRSGDTPAAALAGGRSSTTVQRQPARQRPAGEGSSPPGNGHAGALEFDASNDLQATLAAYCETLADLEATRDGREPEPDDASQMLAVVSTTTKGKRLDGLAGAPAAWLAVSIRQAERFAHDEYGVDLPEMVSRRSSPPGASGASDELVE